MPSNLTVRPVQGKFLKNHDLIGKMDPYCIVYVGDQKVKGKVCKNGGLNPHWNDTLTLQTIENEPNMYLEFKDQDIFIDDLIGICEVDLKSISKEKQIISWFPVFNKKEKAGEVLLEITYAL